MVSGFVLNVDHLIKSIKQMRKIAIIQFHDDYNDYDNTRIIDSITDWREVDDDTFQLLKTNLELHCKIV